MRFKLLSFIAVIAFAPTTFAGGDVIRLAGDPWCPFVCSVEPKLPGFGVEIARRAFELAGHSTEFSEMAWAKAVVDARGGKKDALVGALKADAPEFIFPKNSIGRQISCFYTLKKSNWSYSGNASLSKKALGVVNDYKYGSPLDQYIEHNQANHQLIDQIAGIDTVRRQVRKLVSSRVDVFVEDQSVMAFFFQHDGAEYSNQLRKAGCLKGVELYVAFSSADPEASRLRAAEFDRGVATLNASGELKKIMAKYGLNSLP